MAASIAAQSHCFADLFCKCMIIQHHTRSYNIIHYHTCVQKPLEAPSRPSLVNDPTMQELDHSRARANDLQKTQAEQLAEITRISKELEILSLLVSLWLWCIIGCSSESMKELPLFFQFPLRLMHLSPDRINFWQADLLIFLYFVMVMFRFTLAGARRNAAKFPQCMLWKKNTRQRCPSSLRTVRLFPVSNENTVI